jgi:hypothetical protein
MIGTRFGWRLPTLQELQSLFDDTQALPLPAGHPFVRISGPYWTSTHIEDNEVTASGRAFRYVVSFDVVGAFDGRGIGLAAPDSLNTGVNAWCVRGGSGQDVQ